MVGRGFMGGEEVAFYKGPTLRLPTRAANAYSDLAPEEREYADRFNRPNVTLVDTADHGGVTRMTEHAIVVGGTSYEVDCVIFATGFQVGVSDVLSGLLPVYGRDGVRLLAHWAGGPRPVPGRQFAGLAVAPDGTLHISANAEGGVLSLSPVDPNRADEG